MNNIPLFLLYYIDATILRHLGLGVDELAIGQLLFQQMSFFATGGSNSISTIDLSNAYNGVNNFNVAAVGFLVFLINWVGPIWWAFEILSYLAKSCHGDLKALRRHVGILNFLAILNVVLVMLACVMFRSHLFVWTVFSPKYLYCTAWGLAQHFCVNLGIVSFTYMICSRVLRDR